MRFELSRKAQADLDDIRDYSLGTFGVARAIAYVDAIEQAFRRILIFPEVGAEHPTIQPAVRSLYCQQHRILYEVMEDRIVILRVLHRAMDVEQHLQGP
jgi:toxin ParE1/3/4